MANTQVETVGQGAERVKLWGAFLVVVLALCAFYVLHDQSGWVRWLALVVGLAIAVVIFFLSDSGKRLWAFGHDSTREMRKVVWPSRKEAIQMTVYVFGFVVIMALVLWAADKTLEWIFYDLILGWKK